MTKLISWDILIYSQNDTVKQAMDNIKTYGQSLVQELPVQFNCYINNGKNRIVAYALPSEDGEHEYKFDVFRHYNVAFQWDESCDPPSDATEITRKVIEIADNFYDKVYELIPDEKIVQGNHRDMLCMEIILNNPAFKIKACGGSCIANSVQWFM